MDLQKKDISIIIPVYNSGKCINGLVNELSKLLLGLNKTFEIILIDDCSRDNSWEIIKQITEKNKSVTALLLTKNFGQHKATLCGMNHCNGDIVITMDDDFEHNLEEIPRLITQLQNSKNDIIYAVPADKRRGLFRTLVTRFYKIGSRLENDDAGKGSSFRFMKKNLVDDICTHKGHLFFIDELILWHTSHVKFETVSFKASQKQTSGYTFKKLFGLSMNVFFLSTTMQLKLVRSIGLSISLISFSMGVFYFVKKLFFKPPHGYTSIIVSILFSAGLILFCLGIIGEYLANILMMQNQKPAYTIKEKL